jgi:hypothetical protein
MKDAGTHHHGPLAGISAGAAVALMAGVLMLATARRQLGEVATVVAWALMAAVVGVVIAAAVYAFLWLRHRVRHPEVLAPRRQVRAEVMEPEYPQVIAARQSAAIEPPRVYLNVTPAELAAIMRHHVIPGTAGDANTEEE